MNRPILSLATLSLVAAAALVATNLAACSSDSSTADAGPVGTPGTVNTQAAKSSSTTLVGGVAKAVDSNDGQGSLSMLISGAQQAQSIVTPSAGAAGAKPSSVGLRDLDLVGTVAQAITSCEGACTGTTCDFKGCGTDTPQSSILITGTLSWTGGNLKCVGLTYDVENKSGVSGSKTKFTLDCDVKASSATLTGYVKSTGKTSIQSAALAEAGVSQADVSWASETVFNDVKYASGKPTSGSVKVVASSTYVGQTYTGTAEVTFP